jgi:hypothetical protein
VAGWVLVLSVVIATPAPAQDIEKYVSIGPVANWVDIQSYPTPTRDKSTEMDINYLLVDNQSWITKQTRQRFTHYADSLNTANGVEQNSTITIEFDPSFQKVIIHDVGLIRGDRRINELDYSKLKLFRMETDRDRLVYNETM